MTATDGTTLEFDYQDQAGVRYITNPPNEGLAPTTAVLTNTATPAWLNVQRWGFTGNEQVSVVVVDLSYASVAGPGFTQQRGERSVNLTWDSQNQKFTGRSPIRFRSTATKRGTTLRSTTNTNSRSWSTAPGSNFSYDLGRQAANNCGPTYGADEAIERAANDAGQ